MKRVAIILGVLLVLSWSAAPPLVAQVSNGKGPTTPQKIDEFGSVGHCDLGARLDNYAITFQGTKIRNDRVVIIFLPGTETDSQSITLWFVPKGQPLPDPNKVEEEEDSEPPRK